MGRSFCTTTQIDITKWYILPELFPKSKGKSSGGRATRIRQVSYHKGQKELMIIPLSFVFFVVVYFKIWMRLQRTTDQLPKLLGVSCCLQTSHTALSHRFSELPGQTTNVTGGKQAFNVGSLSFIGGDKLG